MQIINIYKLPSQARIELLDFYAFLLNKYMIYNSQQNLTALKIKPQPQLGDLAVQLFGIDAGIELTLPHNPLELDT